jgi:hypothetical protein
MKTTLINTALVAFFSLGNLFAQDVTTVTANNTDISDNLDLQAVASIFGESADLEDFERRLNNPDSQISNLDLNSDGRVDYLRVIEATENNTHLIILQSVLAAETFQDVATIEVERDSNNNVSVQVVGDTYMYGSNYIYEPVYAVSPPIYNVFWASSYRPYYSPWYWGYYPTYYSYWAPYPIVRYRNHIHSHINVRNTYVYVNNRASTRAVNMYGPRRQNGYERQHPNTSFATRNNNVSNRHELDQNRSVATRNTSTRGATTTRGTSNAGRTSITPSAANGATRGAGSAVRNNGNNGAGATRGTTTTPVRANSATPSVRSTTPARTTTAPARATTAPARTNTAPAVRSTPAQAPVRQSAPAPMRSTPAPAPVRQSAPSPAPVRQSAPAPAVRSTPAPAPQQSAPAPARSTGGSGRRG